jgi:hypothetical protein
MTFAAIVAFHLLSLAWTPGSIRGLAPVPRTMVGSEAPASQSQDSAPQPQTPSPAQTPSAGPSPPQNPPTPAKPSPTRPRRRKTIPNCTTGSPSAGSTNSTSATLKPCPPQKKVIRNGGSSEPVEQLTGGTNAPQEYSTAELTTATEENLKKITGLQLSPSQQDMVNQIKQYIGQSKAAVAARDLDGAHNFARKAHLLSEELVKP